MKRKMSCILLAGVVAAVFLLIHPISAQEPKKGSDRVLSKITFVHYKKAPTAPPRFGTGANSKKNTDGFYTYISRGAKWKTPEDVNINPACNDGDVPVFEAAIIAMNTWETAGDMNLVIFGNNLIEDATATYSDGAYRRYNTISFGSYDNPRVIAVTTVWGYFTGPSSQREIVEAHILLNDNYVWGNAVADGNAVMDLQNIFTHELGHWAGMGDVYATVATEETMYGYSDVGEIKKRDLYEGDITGITNLYK